MKHETRTEGGVTVVAIDGELERSEAAVLRDLLGSLVAGPQSRVLLDLSRVTFIDSSGIAVLVGAHRRAAEAGARLGLAEPTAGVRRVLELTRTDRVLSIFGTPAEGLAALRS